MFCTLRYTSSSRWATEPQPHKGPIIPTGVSSAALAGSDTALITHQMMKSTQAQEHSFAGTASGKESCNTRACAEMCMFPCEYLHVYSPVWLLSAWRECEWRSRSCCGRGFACPSYSNPWTFVSPSEDYNNIGTVVFTCADILLTF